MVSDRLFVKRNEIKQSNHYIIFHRLSGIYLLIAIIVSGGMITLYTLMLLDINNICDHVRNISIFNIVSYTVFIFVVINILIHSFIMLMLCMLIHTGSIIINILVIKTFPLNTCNSYNMIMYSLITFVNSSINILFILILMIMILYVRNNRVINQIN